MKTDLPRLLLFSIILLLHLSAEQVPIDDAPRIVTENGNIIFRTASKKSIRFQTSNGGKIKLNNIELDSLSIQITAMNNAIEQIKELKKCNCEQIKTELANNKQQILSLQSSLMSSTQQITSLSNTLKEITDKITIDECTNNPCHNGGTCVDGYDKYKCVCTENFKGPNCMDDVNECTELAATDLGCQNNARCENYVGGFRCVCTGKWSGVLCNLPLNGCAGSSNTELCGHGTCIADLSTTNLKAFKCICDIGWVVDPITKTCIIDIDECVVGRFPCSVHPPVQCINYPGHFTCGSCPPGFEGDGFQCRDINECASANICGSNEECINNFGSYKCQCVEGMRRGMNGMCSQLENVCERDNGGCSANARCVPNNFRTEGRICSCNSGYIGTGVGSNGCTLEIVSNATNPAYRRCVRRQYCQNGGRCQATANGFRCQCEPGFSGARCRTIIINPCLQNPCLNEGQCEFLTPTHYRCHCKVYFTGVNCENEHSECGGTILSPNEQQQISLMVSQPTQSSIRSFRFPCVWTIIVTNDQFIQIIPSTLQLKGPCSEEYVQLEEKSSMGSTPVPIGRYCQESNSSSQAYNTSGPILFIKASLRNRINQLHGFTLKIIPRNITIDNLDCCKCNNDEFVGTNSVTGIFQSVHFPLNYPTNYKCIMKFDRHFGVRYRIDLHLRTIDLGNQRSNCTDSDFLKITFVDRGEMLITACNQQDYYNKKFDSSGFQIQHFSDSRTDTNNARFKLTWAKSALEDPCGGIVTLNPDGIINSPALSGESEAYCTWKIDHTNTSRLISFKGAFENWQNGDCSVFLKIINFNNLGEHRIIWQTCQTEKMLDQLKTQIDGDVIIILGKFQGVSIPPFQITVQYVCGQSIDMDQVASYEMQSDNYPNNYDDNSDCIYNFYAVTRQISVSFQDFDVNDEYPCNSDYLEVLGSNSRLLNQRYCNGNGAELITITKHSSISTLSLIFKSNSSISGRGFRAQVKAFECGGSFFLKNNLFVAYPEAYLNMSTYHLSHQYNSNKNCTWDIYSSPGTYMIAIFDHFHLEYHPNCRYDYLSVSYDNRTRTFCGNSAESFNTQTNRLRIQFVSDYIIGGEGFQIRLYSSPVARSCHKEIEASEGIIFSPVAGTLSRPYFCIYTIKVQLGRKIGFNITISGSDYSSEDGTMMPKCFAQAKLKVINGGIGSTAITDLCPQNPQRGEIKTSYNKATIIYLVPKYRSAPEFNFSIAFYSIDEECGSIHSDNYGEIASPNYPLFAVRHTFCSWEIKSKPGHRISIKMTNVRSGSVDETERCYSKKPVIKLQSLTKEISIACSNHTFPIYVFDDQTVRVTFNNEMNERYRFRLYYRKVCSYTTDAMNGRIENDNLMFQYPNYCRWSLKSLRGSSIAIQIDEFDLPPTVEGICTSYVEISDQKGTVMRKTCGNELLNRTFVSGNFPITIKHSIDTMTSTSILKAHKGLTLEYQTQGCVKNIVYDPHEEYYYGTTNRRIGEISSPNYPDSVIDIDCSFNFQTIVGYSIKITFDIVEIDSFTNCTEGPIIRGWETPNTNDDNVLDICDRHSDGTPMIFQTSTHNFYMIFFSANDVNGGHRKFHAKYEFVTSSCEHEITLPNGVIQSPNYPNLYPSNIRCKWNLKVREGMSIHLQFLDLQMEGGSCSYDYVQMSSPVNDELISMGRVCGMRQNVTDLHFESINNQMTIIFRTDHSANFKGFKAKFFEGCGGLRMATGRNEFLLSPNYPQSYSLPDGQCEWTLAANISEPNLRIFLYFISFEAGPNNYLRNCSLSADTPPDNSLTIIEGTGESTSVIAILCSNQPYHPIISTGHYIKVVLRSSTGHAIFKASYGTGSSACGGEFNADDGIITSPFYPNPVNMEIDCVYTIKNSPGSEISLIFEDFTRQNRNAYILHDFLDIRNGPNETSPLLGRFYTLNDLQNVTNNLKFNNSIWLRLRSQGGDYTNHIKFLTRYHIRYKTSFRSDQGVLASPQFGQVYKQDTMISWNLEGETVDNLQITFKQFSVGRKLADGNCDRGRLTITDSNGIEKSYCGPMIPPAETFSTPIVIELSAEGYRYPGFLLEWAIPRNETHTKIDNCSFIIRASKDLQFLTSPNYPGFDPDNLNCQWVIQTDNNRALEIQMLNFSLENTCKFENFSVQLIGYRSAFDFYKYYFQNTTCGSPDLSTFDFFNNNYFNRVKLNFKVDPVDLFPGFRLSYKIKCFYDIADSIEGWIQNDEYPFAMSESKNCTYRLILNGYRNYELNFTALSLPPESNGQCLYGYVEISTMDFTRKHCGTNIPSSLTPLRTNSSIVIIRLVGDFAKYSSYSGFQLKYSLEQVEECGGTHYLYRLSDYLLITNPRNVSDFSPDYIECQWRITSIYSSTIQIDFEMVYIYDGNFNNPCTTSFLAFYDGTTTLAPKIGGKNYCSALNSIFTSGNSLLIMFKHGNGMAKFQLRVKISSCGGIFSRRKGVISSPNFPSNYPKQSNCSWTIQLRRRYGMSINIVSLQLETCDKSNLKLIAESDVENNLVWSNCNQSLSVFNVFSNKLKILFATNTTTPRNGFQLKYESRFMNCGGEYYDPSGKLESLNYPSSLPPHWTCYWRIEVDLSKRIVITILNLNVRRGCLMIRGYNNAYRRKFCNTNLENYEIDTKTYGVYVNIYNLAGGRLSFRYHSDLPSICGGNIYADVNETGIISMRNLSTPFCGYVIHNYPNIEGTIALALKTSSGLTCNYNGLRINSAIYRGSPMDLYDYTILCDTLVNKMAFATFGKKIKLIFSPISYVNLTNFNVRVAYKYNRCGGLLTEPSGIIQSPGYPEKYPDYANCEWLLKAPDSMHIKILIRKLHLEPHQNCKFDYLFIRYGANFDSPPFQSFCGKHPIENDTIIFRNNYLRISFHSDHIISKDGFLIEYTFFDAVDNCNGVIFNTMGSIQSPNYPRAHPSHLRCNWTVVVPQGYHISVTFAQPFDIESSHDNVCRYDALKIFDSNSTVMIANLCGNIPPSKPIISSKNKISFFFHTDFNHNLDGFKANYKSVCGGIFNESFGEIRSPNRMIGFGFLTKCSFTVPSWQNSLTIVELYTDLKDCIFPNGNIEIFLEDEIGNYYFNRKICGKSVKPITIITKRSVLIKYNFTWGDVTRYSFRARYLHDENVKIYRNITQREFIKTPQFPSPYHHNADLMWIFYAPIGFNFFIKLGNVDIEAGSTGCPYDYLAFYNSNSTNSSNLVNIFCGKYSNINAFRIDSNILTVHFSSDFTHAANHSGFIAQIIPTPGPQFGCGGFINVTAGVSGHLSSLDLNNDGFYDNNQHCEWQLSAPFGSAVKITFENSSVQLEKRWRNRCFFDYIKIYDGPFTISPEIQTICGFDQVDPIITTSNNMMIVFRADESIVFRGFKLTYTSVSAQNHIVVTVSNISQTLTSPGYPTDTPYDLKMYAEILTAEESDHILVEVNDLKIRPSLNCSLDRFIIQDVSMKHGNKIRTICKSLTMPYAFISSHNMIVVQYQIGPSENILTVPSRRFSLDYRIYTCNRTEQAYSGSIINIESLKQVRYRRNQVCKLNLKAPADNLVYQFYFKNFHIESSSACNYDYVQFIFGAPQEQGIKLPKMCGSLLPASFVSNSSQVSMIFVTDQSVERDGFHITYVVNRNPQMKCGGDIDQDSGAITSPGFGHNYYEAGQCTWNIVVQMEKAIKWKITHLGLSNVTTNEEACNSNTDFVQVKGKVNTFKFCGNVFNDGSVLSETNSITVEYKSIAGGTGIGFRLEWDLADIR